MKKIALSVDEKVMRAARRIAAEQGRSVNALVRDYLTGLMERKDQTGQARQRIRKLSERSQSRIGNASWRRDKLHAR